MLPTLEGPILVALAELEQREAGEGAASDALDLEHESILAACLGDKLEIAPALDVVLSGRSS